MNSLLFRLLPADFPANDQCDKRATQSERDPSGRFRHSRESEGTRFTKAECSNRRHYTGLAVNGHEWSHRTLARGVEHAVVVASHCVDVPKIYRHIAQWCHLRERSGR